MRVFGSLGASSLGNIMNINKHSFSLEVIERSAITHFQISSDSNEAILIEGYLGDILSLKLIEDVVLEIRGRRMVLRIDIDR